jgi:hypothetical protein
MSVPRLCTACGTKARPWQHYCTCGARLPLTKYVPRTTSGERRRAAAARTLAGMRDIACPKCGLHGEHECMFTAEWKENQLALMANRQRTQ